MKLLPAKPASRIRRLYLLFLLLAGTPLTPLFIAGAILLLLSEALIFWSYGLLRRKEELAVGGPYALVRNPVYCGVIFANTAFFLLAGAGLALPCDAKVAVAVSLNGVAINPPVLAAFVLFLPFSVFHYLRRIRREEAELSAAFGSDWQAFCTETPNRLLPRFWRLLSRRTLLFVWSGEVALRNRVASRITKYALWGAFFCAKWFWLRLSGGVFGWWVAFFGAAVFALALLYAAFRRIEGRFKRFSN